MYNPYLYGAFQPPQMQIQQPMQQSVPQQYQAPLPQMKILEANGRPGVDAYRMGPDSSGFFADKTEKNIGWIKVTDSAGTPSVQKVRIEFIDDDDAKTVDDNTEYVKKDDFDAITAEIKGVSEKLDKLIGDLNG